MSPRSPQSGADGDRLTFPGAFGGLSAAVVAVPAWSGVLVLDERWAVMAAPVLGVVVARGFVLAGGRIEPRSLTSVAAITVVGALAGEAMAARFIGAPSHAATFHVWLATFRDPPCWGALALAAALAGAWWAVRAMAPRAPAVAGPVRRAVLARATAPPR